MGETVAIIGVGVIGGAIVKRLHTSQVVDHVVATRRRIEKLDGLKGLGVETTSDNIAAVSKADVVFICVKPGDVATILEEMKEELKGKLVITTVAIIPLSFYRKMVPGARFVRTMPNVAAFVGESFTAYSCGQEVEARDRETIERLLTTLGRHEEVEEKYMNAVTGLSGSGPAYISIVIEALMYAGLKVGLPRELSLNSSAQVVLGTARLILDGEYNASEIKDMVTTPGGTTIEGIYQLEDGKLRIALMNAVLAATEKCNNISHDWENDHK